MGLHTRCGVPALLSLADRSNWFLWKLAGLLDHGEGGGGDSIRVGHGQPKVTFVSAGQAPAGPLYGAYLP